MRKCALCGCEFAGSAATGCAGCPMGCTKGAVCCPRCGYKTVERSATIEFMKKLFTRRY